jgi:hypothetical protein
MTISNQTVQERTSRIVSPPRDRLMSLLLQPNTAQFFALRHYSNMAINKNNSTINYFYGLSFLTFFIKNYIKICAS